MKVFFIADRRAKDKMKVYNDIIKEIEKSGSKVDRSWINRSSEEDSHDIENAYKRNMKSIKEADVVVAEVTELTSGVGFLISTALNQKKPVLALFNKANGGTPSNTLKGSNNKLMDYREYTVNDIPSQIKGFFAKVKGLLDTKFILIISPQIERYLEWSSDFRRMHKAQIVRQAVEDMMDKDREFKAFLKD
jgi:nucleoside 2-deoxyribosyltransferase